MPKKGDITLTIGYKENGGVARLTRNDEWPPKRISPGRWTRRPKTVKTTKTLGNQRHLSFSFFSFLFRYSFVCSHTLMKSDVFDYRPWPTWVDVICRISFLFRLEIPAHFGKRRKRRRWFFYLSAIIFVVVVVVVVRFIQYLNVNLKETVSGVVEGYEQICEAFLIGVDWTIDKCALNRWMNFEVEISTLLRVLRRFEEETKVEKDDHQLELDHSIIYRFRIEFDLISPVSVKKERNQIEWKWMISLNRLE